MDLFVKSGKTVNQLRFYDAKPPRPVKARGGQPKTERNQAMVDLYKKGVSVPEIAERFGIARNSVYAIFSRWGIKVKRKKQYRSRHLTAADKDKMKALYRDYLDGKPYSKLIADYGLTKRAIDLKLIKMGIENPTHRTNSHFLTVKPVFNRKDYVWLTMFAQELELSLPDAVMFIVAKHFDEEWRPNYTPNIPE